MDCREGDATIIKVGEGDATMLGLYNNRGAICIQLSFGVGIGDWWDRGTIAGGGCG